MFDLSRFLRSLGFYEKWHGDNCFYTHSYRHIDFDFIKDRAINGDIFFTRWYGINSIESAKEFFYNKKICFCEDDFKRLKLIAK